MSTIIQRSFRILEDLSLHPKGRTLSELACEMEIPLSATHRLLNDLMRCGYVRRDERHGDFTLAMPMVSLGLRFLSANGVLDVAQPVLERLAERSGELVRLAIVDHNQILFVANAQGAIHGLRYDPEMGRPARLSCSAAGFVWLATRSEEEALRVIAEQDLSTQADAGPNAPKTAKAVMSHVRATRKRGFAMTANVFAPAMSSMAAPVFGREGAVLAILIIAGPTARLTRDKMLFLASALIDSAEELTDSSGISPMFRQAPNRLQLSSPFAGDKFPPPFTNQPQETP